MTVLPVRGLQRTLRAFVSAFPARYDSEERKRCRRQEQVTVDSFDSALSLTRNHVHSSDCPSLRLTQDSGAQLNARQGSIAGVATNFSSRSGCVNETPSRAKMRLSRNNALRTRNTSGRQSAAVRAVGNRRPNDSGGGGCAHTTQRRRPRHARLPARRARNFWYR